MVIITSMANVRSWLWIQCESSHFKSPASVRRRVTASQSKDSKKVWRLDSSPSSLRTSDQDLLHKVRGAQVSSRPKQKDSFPFRSERMIQNTANSAPIVR